MPLYEYQCKPNGHRFEVRHGINDDPVRVCPECGGEVRRVINPVGIVFKGSGFYATDSRKSSSATSKPGAQSDTAAKSDAGAKSDGSKSDGSKSESTKSEGTTSADKTPA